MQIIYWIKKFEYLFSSLLWKLDKFFNEFNDDG